MSSVASLRPPQLPDSARRPTRAQLQRELWTKQRAMAPATHRADKYNDRPPLLSRGDPHEAVRAPHSEWSFSPPTRHLALQVGSRKHTTPLHSHGPRLPPPSPLVHKTNPTPSPCHNRDVLPRACRGLTANSALLGRLFRLASVPPHPGRCIDRCGQRRCGNARLHLSHRTHDPFCLCETTRFSCARQRRRGMKIIMPRLHRQSSSSSSSACIMIP